MLTMLGTTAVTLLGLARPPTHAAIRNSSHCHRSYFHTMCQLSPGRSSLRDMGGAHLLAGAEEAVVASHLLSTPELGAPLPAPRPHPRGPARCAVGLRPV